MRTPLFFLQSDFCGSALKQIKHDQPNLPVLILSMFPEDQYAVRTIRAGAAGYLNKESAPEELVQAIRKILHGGEYISASVADELVLYARHEDDQPLYKHLSDREYQVMCLIASGKEVKEISSELALSPKTISTYRTRLLVKMNMKSNAELTHYAIQNGLV
jgi:two-component system invasion response regulator UvrY